MSWKQSPPIRAAFWMIGTLTSFTLLAVSTRELSFQLDTFELVFYRSFLSLVVLAAFAKAIGRLPRLNFQKFRLQCLRNAFQFAGMSCWFFAIASIPLAQVFAFEFTTPLWVALMAAVYLKEPLTPVQLFSVALGAVGIFIVARPGQVEFTPGTWAAVFCAIGFAGSAVLTRKLTRYQGTIEILLWMLILQSVAGLAVAGRDLELAVPSINMALPLIVMSVAGVTAHYCLTKALSIAPAAAVAPIDFFRLPLIAVIGMLAYGEALELAVFAGGAIICVGNFLNVRSRIRI
ncbi:MAG: DMT family transporter [Albidovulum sp.]|nr:DMT family transporter [Albidovulum sp.]MDE0532352.1 DMT family transporter [Albidovulum sp.]